MSSYGGWGEISGGWGDMGWNRQRLGWVRQQVSKHGNGLGMVGSGGAGKRVELGSKWVAQYGLLLSLFSQATCSGASSSLLGIRLNS